MQTRVAFGSDVELTAAVFVSVFVTDPCTAWVG